MFLFAHVKAFTLTQFAKFHFPGYMRNIIALKKTTYTVIT